LYGALPVAEQPSVFSRAAAQQQPLRNAMPRASNPPTIPLRWCPHPLPARRALPPNRVLWPG